FVLKANSGAASTAVFPPFPYTGCHGFSGAKAGPLPAATLVEADVPATVVNEFLYLNGDGTSGVIHKAANLTAGPAHNTHPRRDPHVRPRREEQVAPAGDPLLPGGRPARPAQGRDELPRPQPLRRRRDDRRVRQLGRPRLRARDALPAAQGGGPHGLRRRLLRD